MYKNPLRRGLPALDANPEQWLTPKCCSTPGKNIKILNLPIMYEIEQGDLKLFLKPSDQAWRMSQPGSSSEQGLGNLSKLTALT